MRCEACRLAAETRVVDDGLSPEELRAIRRIPWSTDECVTIGLFGFAGLLFFVCMLV